MEHSTELHSVAIGCIHNPAQLAMASDSALLQAEIMLISEVRLLNIQLLRAKARGTQKDFAARIGTTANSLNQMLTKHRNVGDRTARRIEKLLKLAHGWMDQSRPMEWENMLLAAYDERFAPSRVVSRQGTAIAARLDSLADDRAVEHVVSLIAMYEEIQAAKSRLPLLEHKHLPTE